MKKSHDFLIDHLTRLVMFLIVPALGLVSVNIVAKQATPAGFGVAAAVQQEVTLVKSMGDSTILISGSVISQGDSIVTNGQGGLQVLLSDGTVFTLGVNTIWTLDRYDYDPATGQGEIRTTITHGTYKLVTGTISEINPGNVSVDIPTGRITLLGTIIAGDSDEDGDTVVLLGPGARRNSVDKKGSFEFIPKGAAVAYENEESGEPEILVYRAGYAVTVSPDGTVSEPYEMSGRDFGQLVSSLARNKGNGDIDDGDDSAGDLAGDDELGDDLLADNDDIDDGHVEDGEHDNFDALLEAQDLTKIADLNDINSMSGSFTESGIDMDNGGTFDFHFAFSKPAAGDPIVDAIGFFNIDTAGLTDAELSYVAARDGVDPMLNDDQELFFFLDDDAGTLDDNLNANGDCVGVCTGSVAVLNAGVGNIAKFFALDLDTVDDTYRDVVVKPGGNNNFPQDDPPTILP